MNKVLTIVLLSVILTACGNTGKRRSASGWLPSGNTEADALTDSLAIFFGHNNGRPETHWLHRLESIAAENPHDMPVHARARYWKVRSLIRSGRKEEAARLLSASLAEVDSARFEDDWRHLRLLSSRFNTDLLDRYAAATDNLQYFRRNADSSSIATELMNLGDIMEQIHEYERGRRYCAEASAIWRAIGQEEYADKNLLNLAIMADRATADSIHRYLLGVPRYRNDHAFYCLLLRNLYLSTDSVHYLREALRATENDPPAAGIHAIHCALYSHWLSDSARFDEALGYARMAAGSRPASFERRFDMLIAHAFGKAYHGLEMADSAEGYLLDYITLRDSITAGQELVETANNRTRQEIIDLDHSKRLKAERDRLTLWIIIMGMALAILALLFTFYRRIKAHQVKAYIARHELEQTKARLGRETVLIEEKEQLLKSLRAEIARSVTEDAMPPKISGRLLAMLKMHDAAGEERRSFLDVHDNLLPGFSARLKKTYPDLSEKQLRLAAYICAGMSSGAIARVLNINPDSVHKNRYRLRVKLGLSQGDSLENFLRGFTS